MKLQKKGTIYLHLTYMIQTILKLWFFSTVQCKQNFVQCFLPPFSLTKSHRCAVSVLSFYGFLFILLGCLCMYYRLIKRLLINLVSSTNITLLFYLLPFLNSNIIQALNSADLRHKLLS